MRRMGRIKTFGGIRSNAIPPYAGYAGYAGFTPENVAAAVESIL